jgi:hypothetical protein
MLTLIAAAVLMIGAVSRQDLPAVTESHGAFGFPNLGGTEIIVLHEIPQRRGASHSHLCRTLSLHTLRASPDGNRRAR